MAVPWMRLLDAVLGMTDVALSRRDRKADEERSLAPGVDRGPAALETRLAGVVVAALKEAFDRDNRRLEFEREQADAERMRAARLLRAELARQSADRELGGLRVTAAIAVATLLGTLMLSSRILAAGTGPRVLLGCAWAALVGALASTFLAQSRISRLASQIDGEMSVAGGIAGTAAAWLVIAALAFIGIATLMS